VSASALDLLSQSADLVGRHPWLFLLAALVVGLIAPARVRRIARVTATGVCWVAVGLYLLPLAAFYLALKLVGLDLAPANVGSVNSQLRLPFE
jgi:hypothetical protein